MRVPGALGSLALALTIGGLTAPAAAPAVAEAALSQQGPAAGEPRHAPRELYLVVGSPSFDHVTLRAVADDWAAGHRVVLQRRAPDGWTTVATRRFSPVGRARWQVSWPDRQVTYRAVTRVAGERIVSTPARISQ
ncbi:hypothetical protein GCM10023339_22050 [Alloalcanivorax gelatiniphagus]